MSLINTLAKVAIGVAVAKGVSTLAKGASAPQRRQGGAGATAGGLEDIMGSLLGGGRAQTPPARATVSRSSAPQAEAQGGSLGELLDELGGQGRTGQSRPARPSTRSNAPDLGAILGQLTGGLGARPTSAGRSASGGASGGIGDLLGSLVTAGGLGGLVGSMLGGSGASAQTSGNTGATGGSLGGLLNAALNGTPAQTEPAPQQELAAGLLLRAMIQAAKADGQIDDNEQQKLLSKLGEVTEQERAFVQQELAAPVDPEGLAEQIPAGLEAQAYGLSIMAIDLDNQAEAQYLDRFAKALGLDPQTVNQIHAQVGAPALYA